MASREEKRKGGLRHERNVQSESHGQEERLVSDERAQTALRNEKLVRFHCLFPLIYHRDYF